MYKFIAYCGAPLEVWLWYCNKAQQTCIMSNSRDDVHDQTDEMHNDLLLFAHVVYNGHIIWSTALSNIQTKQTHTLLLV